MKKTRKIMLCIISLVLCLNLISPAICMADAVENSEIQNLWSVDGNGHFFVDGNSIKYSNNIVRNKVPSVIYNEDMFFANGHISFDVKAQNAKDFGVMFRKTGENNYYVLRFDFSSNKMRLMRKVDNVTESVVKTASISLNDNSVYNVDIGLLGSNFVITVNSKEYIRFKDKYLYDGHIGFTASMGKIEISNVQVYENPDDVYESYVNKNKEPAKIYIAKDGSDKYGDGSYEKPVQTVDGAMYLARKAMSQERPVEVIFKEGVYVLDETLMFSEKHSGTAITPITFKAEEGKKVEFDGATRIKAEDFELVTDPEITSRLYPDVVGKVYQIDLSKQGITREQVDWVSNYDEYDEVKDIPCTTKLLVNDRLQTLSRWPNDKSAIITECELGGTGSNDFGGSISFTDDNPLRWTKAKDMYVGGMLYHVWFEEWVPVETVDVEEMKIKMATGSQYGFRKDHFWTAYNLLEEIDMPGEWYADYDTMMLYLYPTEELTKDDVVEISTQKHAFFELNGVKYANFEGFTFKNNAGKLAKMSGSLGYDGAGMAILGNTRNVTIKNCKFSNLGGKGIVTGYYGASSAWDTWRTNVNILIDGCDFINCRLKGVELGGGNIYSMQESGITVSNCFFYGTGVTVGALRQSHGMTFKNNIVSHVDNYAVYGVGSQLRIVNNEVSFCCYSKADMGAIYLGRMLTFHQTNIDNNYIHHFGSEIGSSYRAAAIYLDDCAGGITIKNNITVARPNAGMTTALTFGGGPDVEVTGNISIDAADGFYVQNRVGGSYGFLVNSDAALDQSLKRISSENFVAKFPQITRHLECLNKQYLNYDMQSVYKDNVAYNCQTSDNFTHWDKPPYPTGEYEHCYDITQEGDKYSVFVDPDKQDFRIKNTVVEKYNLPDEIPDETSDVIMGTDRKLDVDEELNSFKLVAPANGETTKYSNRVVLGWELCQYGDEYIYEIATDKNFENVVLTGKTVESGVTVSELNPDTEYYVRVKAISYMKQGFEKYNSNGVVSFKTSNNKYRNNGLLEIQIEKTKKVVLPKIVEGDEAGQYYPGTKAIVEQEINEAEAILTNENTTQDEINVAAKDLSKLEQRIASRVNVCYVPLALNAKDTWTKVGDIADIKYKNGSFIITGGSALSTVSLDKILSNFEVVCFKYRITNFTKNFVTFGLRLQNPSALHYSDSSNYILFKPDIYEVQKRGTIYETGENKGYTNDGEWYDAQIGCISTDAGVNFYFSINGEVISDYLDADNPQYNPGRFAMCVPAGATIEIMPSDNIPEGLYQLSDKTKDLIENGIIEKYDTTSEIFSTVNGNWVEGEKEIYSTEKGATAQFDYMGENAEIYRVAYYHKPSSENDSKVKVRIMSMSDTYETEIDLTKGDEGYVEIGSFKAMSNNASEGNITIQFIGSGNGKLPVSAITLRKSDPAKYPDMFLQKGVNGQ